MKNSHMKNMATVKHISNRLSKKQASSRVRPQDKYLQSGASSQINTINQSLAHTQYSAEKLSRKRNFTQMMESQPSYQPSQQDYLKRPKD